jgi:hypothetical protein
VSGRVRLDLNFDEFQRHLFDLDPDELRQVFKTFRKIAAMDWSAVYRDNGLKWEAIKSSKGHYSIRLSQQCRAVVTRQGDFLCFLALHRDHDGAYGKK